MTFIRIASFPGPRSWMAIPTLVAQALALALILAAAHPAPASAQTVTIKFATLAPEGTTWVDLINEAAKEVEQKSGGKVTWKIFPGGQKGDEKDMMRKMKLGDIQAAGMTGVGLAEILPEIHVLDLPLVFEHYDEVDYVYEKVFDHFHKAFAEKGFELLGWTEVGFVYLFSGQKLRTLDDFRRAKAWSWEGDPLVRALMEEAKVTPVPLALPDVNTSLQTGLIDTVYGPPMGIVAFQWFTKLKYMQERPLAHATGGAVISKKTFDKLSPDLQEILKDVSRKLSRRLTDMTRQQNVEAIGTLKENGIEMIPPPPPAEFKDFEEMALRIRQKLAGNMYPKELLDKILTWRDEFRAKKVAGIPGAAASK